MNLFNQEYARKAILGVAFLSLSFLTHPAISQDRKVLLAIFAHPDDEASVSPILARYAREGVQIYLAIAADGRYGYKDFAGIPKGDSLAQVREWELKCACTKLGIENPISFGLHDQLKSGEGWEPFKEQLATLRTKVTELFEQIKPDVVVTWGPDGFTGHSDHRLVGTVVTEVFGSRKWGKPVNLFQVGLPTSKIPKESPVKLSTVNDEALSVAVSYEQKDAEAAKQAWLCHESQYKPETIEMFSKLIHKTIGPAVYFKPYYPSDVRDTLFE